MEIEEIRNVVFNQIQRLRKLNIKPVCIVVSRDVMYDLESSYYNEGAIAYSPYFSKVGGKEAKSTVAGLPIGVVDSGDDVKGYIQVGGMV